MESALALSAMGTRRSRKSAGDTRSHLVPMMSIGTLESGNSLVLVLMVPGVGFKVDIIESGTLSLELVRDFKRLPERERSRREKR